MKVFILISAILLFAFVFATDSSAQTNETPDSPSKQEKDRPVRIKKKPRASAANCSSSQGLTRLKVTFDKSAKITDVLVVISSGCSGFDKNAIRAARRIKFEPAIKDGEAITQVMTFEYTYSIY